MTIYVALLRAINVGGTKPVAMADLRDLLTQLGMKEWNVIVARNPFRREALRDPSHLVVMALKDAPDPKNVKALQAAITGPEVVRAVGRQAYIVYPDGIGHSRLTNAVIEKTLGTRGTGRNWNTVLKLDALTTTPTPRYIEAQ